MIKYVYSGYGIAFDGKISWSFNDDFARCVKMFGVDNNSLSHTDNLKNDFLILDEGDTFRINKSLGAPEKKLLALKQRQNSAWVCINTNHSYSFVNRKEIYKFKASNKIVNFPSQFCLGKITNKFDYVDSKDISLKGNVY